MKTKQRAGRTVLYQRQVVAIEAIVDALQHHNKVMLIAPMSFGKTLVGIEIAIRHLGTGYALLLIPPQVEKVWYRELEKYYPELMKKSRMESRCVYFASSRYTSQLKHVTALVKSSPSMLAGKIVIAANYKGLMTAATSVVVVDESHLKVEQNTEMMEVHDDKKYVLLGASTAKYRKNVHRIDTTEDTEITAEITYEMNIPQVVEHIIIEHASSGKIAAEIERSGAKHVVLALPTAAANDHLIGPLRAKYKVHDYFTRSVRVLADFTKSGGILVSSIRMIAEGNNFNMCSHLIVCTPSVDERTNDPQGAISLRRIQQIRGRICRQSSMHGVVEVSYIGSNATMIARSMMAHTDTLGYEVLKTSNLPAKLRALLPDLWKKITDRELLAILAVPINGSETRSNAATPVLTVEQLIDIIHAV